MPYGFNEDKSKYDLGTIIDDVADLKKSASDGILACFGDSILAGWSNENPNGIDAWDSYLGDGLGFDSENVFKIGTGGAGFASGTTFAQMVQTMVSDIQTAGKSVNDVTLIVVGGGINDARNSVTESDMYDGVVAFINAALSAFPNAILHVFPMVMGNSGAGTKLFRLENVIRGVCLLATSSQVNRIVYHSGVWSWNYDGNDSGVSVDRVHLLAAGQERVGNSMVIEINGGSAYNETREFALTDINGGRIAWATRRGSTVSFTLANNITSAGASNLAIGCDIRYGFNGGCFAVSNENQNGTRIFFYSDFDACWNSYLPISNAGCYGMVTYNIESGI